ncbi:hypothetical protein VB773_01425 [Haloarculaceae archaeon H-GB2-1]|nr:hypothetical protein [Haloarculaceae archaeon H-GB1-1]MEA5406374.1 hypothetical protein [Haloarculaceae archaeon H-GB2-1]
MIVESLAVKAGATLVSTAALATLREARKTRKSVEKHHRTLYGTQYRRGLVERVEDIEEDSNHA